MIIISLFLQASLSLMLSGTTVNWYSLNEQLLRMVVLIISQPGFKIVQGLHLHILSKCQHKLFKEMRVLLCIPTEWNVSTFN